MFIVLRTPVAIVSVNPALCPILKPSSKSRQSRRISVVAKTFSCLNARNLTLQIVTQLASLIRMTL